MRYDSYNKFATAVQTEIQELNYEQQLNILSIVIAAMNKKSPARLSPMSKEETLSLYHELTGSIKNVNEIDGKKEYLEYLDERYGV